MKKQDLGKLGEKVAAAALKKNGYRIVDKNYRCRRGEIDIIAIQKNCLVFVEVRSKTGTDFGLPEESVSIAKKHTLMATALDYRSTHEHLPPDWRIDFVAIDFDAEKKKATRIEIVENALF